MIRTLGGLLYFAGALIMVWNVWMTVRGKLRDEAPLSTPAYDAARDRPAAPAVNNDAGGLAVAAE